MEARAAGEAALTQASHPEAWVPPSPHHPEEEEEEEDGTDVSADPC